MTAASAQDTGLVSDYEQLVAVLDRLLAAETSSASDDDVFVAAQLQENAFNKLAALGTRRIVELTNRGIPAEKVYPRARDFLTAELHIPDAGKRLAHATQGFTADSHCPTPTSPTASASTCTDTSKPNNPSEPPTPAPTQDQQVTHPDRSARRRRPRAPQIPE